MVMPEPEPGKIFLGGGGGGDLLGFSDSCLLRLSEGAGLGTLREALSRAALAGFSSAGFGNFSGPFLEVSDGSSLGFSVPKNNNYSINSPAGSHYNLILRFYLYLKVTPLGCGC